MNIAMLNIPNNTAEFSKIKVTRLEKKKLERDGRAQLNKILLDICKIQTMLDNLLRY